MPNELNHSEVIHSNLGTRGAVSSALLALLFNASVAGAQSVPANQDSSAGQLETVMVTAQRRAESIQDVPLSVVALSKESLEAAGVKNVMDLQQVDPSLSISAQSGAVIPFIRGIGNIASQTPGNESSVPIYIDDAYYSRLFVPYLSFADNIERVEVLKGPQGTLFGRNATGGLIHIVTRDPGQTTEFSAKLGYGSQQTTTGQVYFATPLNDQLAIDFSFSGQNMGEGFGTNLYNGADTYFRNFYTARSKLVWTPSDTTKVRLSAVQVRDSSSIGTVGGGGLRNYTRGLPPSFTQEFEQPSDFFDINVNYNTKRRHRGNAFTLRVDQEFGFADFSSISFYRQSREPWTSEGDHTNARWLEYDLNVEDKQITQEFQLRSKDDSTLSWIFGLYYMNADAAYDPVVITGEAIELGGLRTNVLIGKQEIDSKAAFGQATLPIFADAANLTLGVRYTQDTVDGFGRGFGETLGSGAIVSFGPPYVDEAKFSKVTYKVALDRSFTPDLLGYTSVSRGYKSGVFNLLPLSAPAVPPEVVDAYDIGLKSTLAGGRAHFNVSLFWNEIEALQTNVVEVVSGVATPKLASADKARTRGVEFDGDLLATDGLTVRFSGQYIDAEFIDFPNAPVVTPLFVAPYGLVGGVGDVSGLGLPQIPEWKLNVGLDYEVGSGLGQWLLGTNVAYRSGFPWEADNVVEAPDLTLVNASVELKPSFARNTSVRVWAKNLTDEHYFGNVLAQTGPAGYLASPAEGRTWGVEFGYRF
ncbi:TonB-dependent receptor [Steroidobacter sp.]|uniref:TonB-dependent receptor n=1 Tax=Steroidobacter sp. TaxID=1978227 RepID=UPI001A3E355B|nr:TonB-dependent receptor [Steroidobacter sp.]MBL8267086.1 TonB-dependent receptor [Steroidobacter sp.]